MQNSRARWLDLIPGLVALVPFLPMLVRGHVPVLRDHADYFLPLRWFTAQMLRSGVVPHWNPLNGLGEQWLANPQTGVLYPPSWILVALPFELGYVLWLAFHLAVLSIGIAAVGRHFASPLAAALAGSAAALAGPVVSMIDVSNNLATLAWLPCIVNNAISGKGMRRSITGGALLALAFLGGEPVFAAIGAAVWLFAQGSALGVRRYIARSAMCAATAITFTAPQLIPFVLTLARSDRGEGLGVASAFQHSLAPRDALELLAPFGTASTQQFVISLLLGPALLILIGAGSAACLRTHRGLALRLILSSVVLTGLAFAASSPLGAAIMDRVGMDAIRHPSRFIVPAFIILAPFAAPGFARLRESRTSWIPAAIFSIVAMVPFAFSEATSVAGLAIAAQIAALVLLIAIRRLELATATSGGLLVASLLLAGSFAFRAAPLDTIRPSPPAVQPGSRIAVQSSADLTQRSSDRPPVAGYTNLFAGISKADSPAPVVPIETLRFVEAAIEGAHEHALAAASVSRLFSRRHLPLEPAGEHGWWKIQPVPIISGWSGVEHTTDDAAALARFLRGDASRIYAPVDIPAPKIERAPVRAALNAVPNGWSILTDSDRNLVLVIGERANQGWKVTIDSQPADWFVVNGLFRGVALPAGRHRVEWQFVAPGWRAGWGIFLAGLGCIALAWRRASTESTA